MSKIIGILLFCSTVWGQKKSYFYEIPKSPEYFTAENLAARMVDGLGFRYYWATESLRICDLAYVPSNESRTTKATLEHIYDLSHIIKNTIFEIESLSDPNTAKYSWEELREKTLENLRLSSENLKLNKSDLSLKKIRLKRADGTVSSFDFWHIINGPIEDAVWHVGQVVSFRRSSGNPLPQGVNVLTGKKM
jgi:hypothetical protein